MLTLQVRYLPLKPGDKVLDLGCGEGRHLTGLLETGIKLELFGIDINLKDLEATSKKLATWYPDQKQQCHLVQTNGLNLPFADNSFDHVICSEVLEHVEDYEAMLNEIQRLIKVDGHVCISVPRAWPEKICWRLSKEYYEVKGGHLRIFNAKTLRAKISALGLDCYKQHWSHALHSPYWWLKCLFWKNTKDNFLLRGYHALLVWDLMKKPTLTVYLEKLLNPIIGKSVVMYFRNRS